MFTNFEIFYFLVSKLPINLDIFVVFNTFIFLVTFLYRFFAFTWLQFITSTIFWFLFSNMELWMSILKIFDYKEDNIYVKFTQFISKSIEMYQKIVQNIYTFARNTEYLKSHIMTLESTLMYYNDIFIKKRNEYSELCMNKVKQEIMTTMTLYNKSKKNKKSNVTNNGDIANIANIPNIDMKTLNSLNNLFNSESKAGNNNGKMKMRKLKRKNF